MLARAPVQTQIAHRNSDSLQRGNDLDSSARGFAPMRIYALFRSESAAVASTPIALAPAISATSNAAQGK